MLPSILAKQLETGIGDYIETTFPMTNEPFKGSVKKMLDKDGAVYLEPYTAVRLPFRVADSMPTCFEAIHPEYLPYVHQQKAFERLTGDDPRSTIIATGTGSGKTECFLYPILEYCYRHRGERGIKALIIYPMNALATDQARRIAKLIYGSPELRGNVTVGMYVGGEEEKPSRMMSKRGVITDHETLINDPPDILMTNYKMLDYLLVRPKDANLWRDNGPETLAYIAVDELHTFDGAQGTDLACLLRRLKQRLGISEGYLCCIGTSATMGSGDDSRDILDYAREVFGENFDGDALITEDRLSAEEYLSGEEVTEFSMPGAEQIAELNRYCEEDDPEKYLRLAVKCWFPDFDEDVMSDGGRIRLGKVLLHHSFIQSLIHLTKGSYYRNSAVAEELSSQYPELRGSYASDIIDSAYALISHARDGEEGSMRPFLYVQVQLWMRELRRLVAKVDPDDISYEIAFDLNRQQADRYLPVINCRECGMTGWTSVLDERQKAAMTDLESFYNMYFRADDRIVMMFPGFGDTPVNGMEKARLCRECFQVFFGDEDEGKCRSCGGDLFDVWIPTRIGSFGSEGHRQYVCPCCGSRGGMTLMGMRGVTQVSADLSQMFASRFNDDKKALAFSDNVQDAAHRAGFFNARTWRFGVRTAIQRYCQEAGTGLSLKDFQDGFVEYWHGKMSDEEFVSYFIGPNMTWRRAYEEMVEKRRLGSDAAAKSLMNEVENRIKYEIMLEYGLSFDMGRTLEKSGCSVLSFSNEDIETISDAVRGRTLDELDILSDEDPTCFRHMVAGYLDIMRRNGAFADPVYNEYTSSDGNGYMLSDDRKSWLPSHQSGRNVPRFVSEHVGRSGASKSFDELSSKKYVNWIASCFENPMIGPGNLACISGYVLEEAAKAGLAEVMPSSPNYKVYGLNKERVTVSGKAARMRCSVCGTEEYVSAGNAALWEGAPCSRAHCSGTLVREETGKLDYYGRLYTNGDLARVNATEHTGLLERTEREEIEKDFKRGKKEQAVWDPNVLSCTPTLELGIDVGDLSSVILCSVPPTQSQFLQRTGRAGRRDGNALTLAVANARPHDLYFYADPLEMIAGEVKPPKIFLRASAVLERQFTAFCMDSWIKSGDREKSIPEKVGKILNSIDEHPEDMYPFNFMAYVERNLSCQLETFMQMFGAHLDGTAREELESFARGDGSGQSPMYVKILDAFQDLKRQREALRKSIQDLKAMEKELGGKPRDFSFDEQIKELKQEESALLNIVREIDGKNVFNFLSDDGLLPNYAFPEDGIVLRAVLYRRDDDTRSDGKKSQKMVYEYNRAASYAISEFAPSNSFYAGGRKLTIDQVDLTTAQSAKWRLCPNCSHAQIEEAGKDVAACPRCGSPLWRDSGQVRDMLKVQMVYSNMDYKKSLIGDESDTRSSTFYCKQMLVDVDEDHDITCAYRMDNEEFPFGYEFVRKATMREINFGESEMTGETMSVAGVDRVRKGFKICKYCGKIQPEKGRPNHTFSCRARDSYGVMQNDPYEECLFLYREFDTEALRLLIPATTQDSTTVKTESFVAAFMLGMKEHFGNVDHLRFTISEVPVPESAYRKQYLVVYDSVPGGTGYLKQLMHEDNALVEILEKALHVMENCSCKDDPQKDGCYHCLYAYRQSQQMGNISRACAMSLFRAILSGKNNIEKIDKIDSISVNPIFDSELEGMFVDAVRMQVGAQNVGVIMRNGKHAYYVKTGDCAWEMEPQVLLDAADGVAVKCKPDFVFYPVSASGRRPVAVFTDGYMYHKDISADDTVKREAIRRGGRFRVWALSYRDVRSAFSPQGDYYTETLAPEDMPSGNLMYRGMVEKRGAKGVEPWRLSSFELLFKYLEMPDAEDVFSAQAYAYSLSLLDPAHMSDAAAFEEWSAGFNPVAVRTRLTEKDFAFPGTAFGSWIPNGSDGYMTVYAGISSSDLKAEGPVSVCAVLDEVTDRESGRFERAWNGFWRFFDLMQFSDEFVAVSSYGVESMAYSSLPSAEQAGGAVQKAPSESAWDAVSGILFGDEAVSFARAASEAGVPAPREENIGYEVEGESGEVMATVEIAWPERKTGFMTTEQRKDMEALERAGWRIITEKDLEGMDVKGFFGGDE